MNKRQTAVLRLLYKNKNYMTVADIAEQTGVSPKTVRNDLAVIKEELSKVNAGSLETKPHIGVRLLSSDEEIRNLKEQNDCDTRSIFFFILRSLFRTNSLTAQKLAERYYLSRSSADSILDEAARWFSENRIVFERRRGKGISIRYSEFNYRMAFLNFFTEYADMYADGGQRSSVCPIISDRDYTAMCAALDGFDPSPAAKAVTSLEQDFGLKFNYMSGVRLVFLLSLCFTRSRKGYKIQMPETVKCPTDGESDLKMTDSLAEKLEKLMNITLTDEERSFITFAVSVSEIQGFENSYARRTFEMMNTGLCRLTVKTANLISEIVGVDLKDDKIFVRQLFLQLKVTTARLKYGIIYKNELLSQIKEKYPNMMAAAWLLGNIFDKELSLEINEHEVGFIALQIGGAIERRLSSVSACIVCDYGIGISRILREKINRTIPELRITGVFSARDMRKIKSEACDFIITTTPLDDYRLDRDIAEIGHLLDGRDVKIIEEHMKAAYLARKGKLKKITPGSSLFSRDLIFPQCKISDKNELLHMLCSKLEILGYVTDRFEKSVFEREASTSTGIGTGIALPHGLSEYVNRSVAVFVSLDRPIEWDVGGEQTDIIFLLAFDLSENGGAKKEIIDFYKSVVTLTENEEKREKLKNITDKSEIIKTLEL